MYKRSLQNFFSVRTSHLIPKIATLAVSSFVLVALVNIDASASAFGGRDSSAVRSDVVLTLASESSSSQFSGLVKRWSTGSVVIPVANPTTTTSRWRKWGNRWRKCFDNYDHASSGRLNSSNNDHDGTANDDDHDTNDWDIIFRHFCRAHHGGTIAKRVRGT